MITTKWLKITLASFILIESTGCVPQQPPENYYPTQLNSNAIPASPHQTQLALSVWANQAAVSVFSYNFVHYKEQFNHTKNYFTPAGWKALRIELEKSGNIRNVVDNKLVVSAVATGAPLILQENYHPQTVTYDWWVQVPLLVEYQSTNTLINKQHVLVEMHIIEASLSPGDFRVDTFITKDLNGY